MRVGTAACRSMAMPAGKCCAWSMGGSSSLLRLATGIWELCSMILSRYRTMALESEPILITVGSIWWASWLLDPYLILETRGEIVGRDVRQASRDRATYSRYGNIRTDLIAAEYNIMETHITFIIKISNEFYIIFSRFHNFIWFHVLNRI